ncbi:MAG: UDP-N-acetylmuramoyl-L-alanine--D-glutamate ligase [Oligoflexales bacterium]
MTLKSNQSWLIIGGGISGLGAAEFLKSQKQRVTIHDDNKPAQVVPSLDIPLRKIGKNEIREFQFVVPSPGVPHSHDLLQEAMRLGVPIVSDIDLAVSDYANKIVAVTGTNGKTTTCLLLADILNKNGIPSTSCGNVGAAPTALRATGKLKGYLSLELSSYQLETMASTQLDCAIATSFSFDHMSRHGSMEGYFDTKWKAFRLLKPGGLGIMSESFYRFGLQRGADFEAIPRLAVVGFQNDTYRGTHLDEFCDYFTITKGVATGSSSKQSFRVPTDKFPFSFDQMNYAMAALAVRSLTGLPYDQILKTVSDFVKPPHRMAPVGFLSNKQVIDDSKSTNLESVMGAVENFDRCILLLGGIDKGESFEPLLKHKSKIEAVFSFGRSNEKIRNELANSLPVYNHARLEHAIMDLEGNLDKFTSSVILFSPGCASFDEFKNFEDRGQFFQEKVKASKRFKV